MDIKHHQMTNKILSRQTNFRPSPLQAEMSLLINKFVALSTFKRIKKMLWGIKTQDTGQNHTTVS